MPADFPRTAAEITNEWLSDVLGATVTSFDVTVLEGGVLSEASRLHAITYDGDPGDAPPSVVVKVAHSVDDQRRVALSTNAYTKELRFFEDLAPQVPLKSPQLYASFSDGSDDSEFFILVMEDLSQHSKVFDQVDDPPDEAFARKLALEVAELHAKFWESSTTQLPWIGSADHRYVPATAELSRQAKDTWPDFRARWLEIFGHDIFDRDEDAPLEELAELLCGPQSDRLHDKIYDILSTRPHTVLHGDLRADNVFRTHPAAGKSAADSTLTIIDWQLIHAGPPGPEFTEAWMHSLEPEVRRLDRDMLREYHEKLVGLNPAAAAYTYDMLLEDYTLSFCFWWTAIISAIVDVLPTLNQPEGARMKNLFAQGLGRSKTAMLDLDCLGAMQRLSAEISADAAEAG